MTKQQKDYIEQLAKEVFDYEKWYIWPTSNGGVSIQPIDNQVKAIYWSSSIDAIDDLRARKLIRYSNLKEYFE